jgi:hypothetical protein
LSWTVTGRDDSWSDTSERGRERGERRYAALRRRVRPTERKMELKRWRQEIKTGIFCVA